MKHCINRAYRIFVVRMQIQYALAKLELGECTVKWLRRFVIAIVILFIGYGIGTWRGIDVGIKHTLSQLRSDLIRGVKDKHKFQIQEIDGICFHPRGDGDVNYLVQGKKECGE